MQIMRLTLTGMATVVLAAMLAGGAADPASAAATPNCKGRHQALVSGQCANTRFENPDRVRQECNGASCYRTAKTKAPPEDRAKAPYDRQLESRGYRATKTKAPSEEQAKAPYDRQLESRGYRRDKGHRAKSAD